MAEHPRLHFAHVPTPVVALDRLGAALGLGSGQLLCKHDDLTGVAGGGNKVRKLEYLIADAQATGCDVVVTGGGRQSNHVRLTAACANRSGVDCSVVLSSDRPEVPTGNVVLDELLRPDITWVGSLEYYDIEAAILSRAGELAEAGRRPYPIPVGGASVVGAFGYVAAADELRDQVADFDLVVVADGSGGTHAGLVAGFGDHARVWGVDVGTRPDLDDQVPRLAAETATRASRSGPSGTVQIDHERYGDAYGAPTDACREALDLAARLEGIVLDPVYTGKAMAGLIAAVREGRIGRDQRVVFLHTGGMPAIFASTYAAWIRDGISVAPPPSQGDALDGA
jgi:D-cysteine desulfhydrase family pyridoxal phosphate-dependent enzyme